jgi:hypothetical protein
MIVRLITAVVVALALALPFAAAASAHDTPHYTCDQHYCYSANDIPWALTMSLPPRD